MKIAISILLIELLVLSVCFGAMIFSRIWKNIQERRTVIRRKNLKKLLTHAMQKQEILRLEQIPSSLLHYPDVLAVVEEFDRLFLDVIWKEIKTYLIENYLKEKSLISVKSFRWRKQLLGLRGIALSPKQLMNKKIVPPFLNSHRFLLRILAASAMVHSEEESLVAAVLKRMAQEPPLARFAYRDLLINSGEFVFHLLEKIAHQENHPEVIAICLDILSTRISRNPLPLAMKYIESPYPICRLASIKLFSKTPGSTSEKYLIRSLSDKESKNRAEAAQGLGSIYAFSSIPALTSVLKDPDWKVRFYAANALKGMGQEGRKILHKQTPQNNVEAYEIAKYVLELP